MTEATRKKALIAMSGGVDSSVAAWSMVQAGYDCLGCTMRLYENDVIGMDLLDTCCSLENTEDARGVCDSLGIPYQIFHFETQFAEDVISPFVQAYQNGRTPNPCIACNRCLKFTHLYQKMQELDCDVLVTGHYARICFDEESGRYQLRKAKDATKDQSYVLYMLTQEQLAHLQLPLGTLQKTETRAIAAQAGLRTAEKHDSQDICFVPDGDYAGFITRYTGIADIPGLFLDANGAVLGTHRGITHYTLGQRRGLGIPAAERLYVTAIDPAQNTVTLGSNADLFATTLYADAVNLISVASLDTPMRIAAKIRYRHMEQPATAVLVEPDRLQVVFDEPQRAITPGQAVVLYANDLVVGGGTICQVESGNSSI